MFDLLLVVLTFSSPILIGIIISRYFKYKLEVQKQLAEIRREMHIVDTDSILHELKFLKERVQVLEQLATDPKEQLKREIAGLDH